jgi:hypothetical protein
MYLVIDLDGLNAENAIYVRRRFAELLAELIEPIFAHDDPIDVEIVKAIEAMKDIHALGSFDAQVATMRHVIDALMTVITKLRPGYEQQWERRVQELWTAGVKLREQITLELAARDRAPETKLH